MVRGAELVFPVETAGITDTIPKNLARVLDESKPGDVLLICGSLYIMNEVRYVVTKNTGVPVKAVDVRWDPGLSRTFIPTKSRWSGIGVFVGHCSFLIGLRALWTAHGPKEPSPLFRVFGFLPDPLFLPLLAEHWVSRLRRLYDLLAMSDPSLPTFPDLRRFPSRFSMVGAFTH